MQKRLTIKTNVKWHNRLGIIGAIALLIFSISGIMHPIIAWTGPKAVNFFPPQMNINATHLTNISTILSRHQLTRIIMAKVIPSEQGVVLQVTESNQAPRRYFDLSTGNEYPDFDGAHASWLARYYTGLTNAAITSIDFQTTFDGAYPSVNRLLPVYRITFDTPDHRTAFIYTELGVLASLTNTTKTMGQTMFRMFHTWSWLDGWVHARVFLMMILLVSLIGMAVTGIALISLLNNRTMTKKRTLHRFISMIVWVPVLMFSISGVYHLLHAAYTDNDSALKLGDPMTLSPSEITHETAWFNQYQSLKLNAISLVKGPNNQRLFRLGISNGGSDQAMSRSKQFDGVSIEKNAIYVDSTSGKASSVTDQDMAKFFAGHYMDIAHSQMKDVRLVTHFSPTYDFRNKRLPVWKIELDTPKKDTLFIDPATGMLVDRHIATERFEGYSFSFLHKWTFLRPFVDRIVRDVIMVIIVLLAIVSTVIGLLMLKKSPK